MHKDAGSNIAMDMNPWRYLVFGDSINPTSKLNHGRYAASLNVPKFIQFSCWFGIVYSMVIAWWGLYFDQKKKYR